MYRIRIANETSENRIKYMAHNARTNLIPERLVMILSASCLLSASRFDSFNYDHGKHVIMGGLCAYILTWAFVL